jgi:hypothetical protein
MSRRWRAFVRGLGKFPLDKLTDLARLAKVVIDIVLEFTGHN